MKLKTSMLTKTAILSFGLLLTPLSWAQHSPSKPLQWSPVTTTSTFDRIRCSGPLQISLSKGPSGQKIWIQGKNHPGTRIYTVDNTLYITTNLPNTTAHQDRPNVRIQLSQLAALDIAGDTTLSTKNLQGLPPFKLIHRGRGSTHLMGELPLRKITQKGPGMLEIAWINSQALEIEAEEGTLRLAGTVRRLYARVYNNAILDAKHLRAKQAWVQTQQAASAHIMALRALNAFAKDDSEIDYYQHPHLSLVINKYASGNVMQVQNWR